MLEWRSATVDRIMALQPRRVLEIGAGSGLVLSQVAPRCEHYVATDMSAVAIDNLGRSLEQLQIPWRDRVQLLTRPAHVTEGLPLGHFDTIILNSVIQYFPHAEYLAEVIDNAMYLLAPGGTLFLGDVRNHTLQSAFHTAVAMARFPGADADEIRQRVRRAMVSETELLLAPEFFTSWVHDQPAVAGLDIQTKRGSADNELNQYRYDVVVHKAPSPARSLADTPTWAWAHCSGLGGLQGQLTSEHRADVRITGIPRAGLVQEEAGTTPEQLHRLGETAGYDVAVTWGAQPGTLDAVFVEATDPQRLTDVYLPAAGPHPRSARANDPHTNTKISAVRQRLRARLPDYMVPAQIVVLDQFPLTSSGKLDKRALPAPEYGDIDAYRAPSNAIEEVLAGIYAQVLGLERVGVEESFFECCAGRATSSSSRPWPGWPASPGWPAGRRRWSTRASGRWWPRRSCGGCTAWNALAARSISSARRCCCRRPLVSQRPRWRCCCRYCWIATRCCGCDSAGVTEPGDGRCLCPKSVRWTRRAACSRCRCCPMRIWYGRGLG
jgi:SAM-dependent methyltransferase